MNNFLLLPFAEQPKYILPTESASLFARSLDLYTPYLLRKKIGIRAFKALAYTRLLKYLPKTEIIDRTKLRDILPLVEEIFSIIRDEYGSINTSCAFYISRKGRYVIQIMNRRARVLGYAKVGVTNVTGGDNRHEFNFLSKLTDKQFANFEVSRIRNYIETPNYSILIVHSPEAPARTTKTSLDLLHIKALIELFKYNMAIGTVSRSRYFNSILADIASVKNENHRQSLERAVRLAVSKIGDKSLPLGFCHGDFKPWNVRLLSADRLYIFDWEMARDQWLPLWDYFHFLLQTFILIKRKSTGFLVKRIMVQNREIKPYLNAFAINKDMYIALLLLHISGVAAYYYATGRVYEDKEALFYVERMHDLLVHLLCHPNS